MYQIQVEQVGALLYKGELHMLPPGVNDSYKIIAWKTKLGKLAHKLALTKEAQQFKDDASWELRVHDHIDYSLINAIKNAAERPKNKVRVPLELHLTFGLCDSLTRRDVDNLVKQTQDALFSYLNLNDKLVFKLIAEKQAAVTPFIAIELRTLHPFSIELLTPSKQQG